MLMCIILCGIYEYVPPRRPSPRAWWPRGPGSRPGCRHIRPASRPQGRGSIVLTYIERISMDMFIEHAYIDCYRDIRCGV